MNERTTLLAGAMIGAAVGTAAAFFFLTDRGRAMRDELEPTIRDLAREAGRLQGAVDQIRESVAGPARPAASARPRA